MAEESFYEDIIIDTSEAAARLEELIKEQPHWITSGEPGAEIDNPEFLRRLSERLKSLK